METIRKDKAGIQITLFDYFKDVDHFTLAEATECVKAAKSEINAPVKEPSIRARIYEGIDKGLFDRVAKGVYTVKKENSTCLLVNGNGRDLSWIEDCSIDCLITDHPYALTSSLKGGNRDFASYDCFKYEQKDFNEKARVMKSGCFVVEFFPEENSENYKYIFECKEMAAKAGLDYYTTVNWKKGNFVSNTGRKSKNTEQVVFFTKGKPRALKVDAKKEKAFFASHKLISCEDIGLKIYVDNEKYDYMNTLISDLSFDYDSQSFEYLSSDYAHEYLEQLSCKQYVLLYFADKGISFINADKDIHFYMSGTNGMLPTEFDVEPVSKSDRIHQAEKPTELIEQIIGYITLPEEHNKILDQFAGSGVVGEAALNTRNDAVLIEKDEETFQNMYKRLNRKGR